MEKSRTISSIEDAFEALGVSDYLLTADEKRQLDEFGYVFFYDLISPDWLVELREAFDRMAEEEDVSGDMIFVDLVNKNGSFDGIYTHPKVLAAVYHVIKQEFKLDSLHARSPHQGKGHQGLHEDWGHEARKANDPYYFVNSLWMLDDFTSDNGATRVVPRSHVLPGQVTDYVKNPSDPHPNQVLLTAPAGTVAVFNGHLWHGGSRNESGAPRRTIHSAYIARQFPQQDDERTLMQETTYHRISEAAKYILDVQA